MIYKESGNGFSDLGDNELVQKIKIGSDIVKLSFTLNNGKDYYGAIQIPTRLLMDIIGEKMKHPFERVNQIS